MGLGPANYAGQLGSLAASVTARRADVSAEVVMQVTKKSFGYPADVKVPHTKMRDLDMQLEAVKRILPRYTHLVVDAFRPPFGGLNGDSVAADLPMLENAGIKVALLAHGSEIRHPQRHAERNRESHFVDAPDPEAVGRILEIAERNEQIASTVDLPIFVTTPDLLDDLPQATWLPVVIDVDRWASDRVVLERRRPVVLHAPSNRGMKGTDRFLPALEILADGGLIELHLAEGMPSIGGDARRRAEGRHRDRPGVCRQLWRVRLRGHGRREARPGPPDPPRRQDHWRSAPDREQRPPHRWPKPWNSWLRIVTAAARSRLQRRNTCVASTTAAAAPSCWMTISSSGHSPEGIEQRGQHLDDAL